MLSEKQLTRICLVVTLIGFVLLLLAVMFLQPEQVNIGAIDGSSVGKVLTVTGTVTDFSSRTGNIFFTLADETGNVSVVMFSSDLDLNNKQAEVTGKVQLYKANLEIIADKIKVL